MIFSKHIYGDFKLSIIIGFIVIWVISMLIGKTLSSGPCPAIGTMFGVIIGIVCSILFGIGVFVGSYGKEETKSLNCEVMYSSPTGEQSVHTVDCTTLK